MEARELLRRRLGDSRTDADPQAVEKIITAYAGLPLALAIAASRAQQTRFPLAMLAAELDAADRRLDTLDAGEPASQVRAVISWSYTTLTSPAARVFRLLGLHPGPDIHTAAAASLASLTPSAVRQLLTELTRASLLTEHTLGRYTFHDLVRAYARELARVHDTEQEQHAALTSLFDYYLAGAAAAMDALFPAEKHRRPRVPTPTSPVPPLPSPGAARDWLNAERASLVAVTTHAVGDWPAHAVLLASTLYRYFETGGHHLDAQVVFTAALDAARKTGDLAAQANSLKCLGSIDTEQGLYRRGADELRSALDLYRQIGDQPGLAATLQELGLAEDAQGRVGQAARQLGRAGPHLPRHRQPHPGTPALAARTRHLRQARSPRGQGPACRAQRSARAVIRRGYRVTGAAGAAARQALLQQAEEDFDPLPFDRASARAFGQVSASLRQSGRKTAARAYDAPIAATALANGLPVYTCNAADFDGIDGLRVVPVTPRRQRSQEAT